MRYDTGDSEDTLDPWQTPDRDAAQQWARALLDRSNWAILDTETTGLDSSAEIVQVAVVAPKGTVAIDTLVKPRYPIPVDVTAIHGITNPMVANAPSFAELLPRLLELLVDRTIIAYNAAFDRRMLAQTARGGDVRLPLLTWECAMERYAQYVGRRSSRRGGFVWQPLPRSGELRGRKHQAIDDCLATLDLIRRMAGER